MTKQQKGRRPAPVSTIREVSADGTVTTRPATISDMFTTCDQLTPAEMVQARLASLVLGIANSQRRDPFAVNPFSTDKQEG